MRRFLAILLPTIFLVALLVGAAVTRTYFGQFNGSLSPSHEAWGQFGDYVGGVLNPTYSLLALFALLATIWIQSKELAASTEQLKQASKAQQEIAESAAEDLAETQRQARRIELLEIVRLSELAVADLIESKVEIQLVVGHELSPNASRPSWDVLSARLPKVMLNRKRTLALRALGGREVALVDAIARCRQFAQLVGTYAALSNNVDEVWAHYRALYGSHFLAMVDAGWLDAKSDEHVEKLCRIFNKEDLRES